jgi:hypothetical protein
MARFSTFESGSIVGLPRRPNVSTERNMKCYPPPTRRADTGPLLGVRHGSWPMVVAATRRYRAAPGWMMEASPMLTLFLSTKRMSLWASAPDRRGAASWRM